MAAAAHSKSLFRQSAWRTAVLALGRFGFLVGGEKVYVASVTASRARLICLQAAATTLMAMSPGRALAADKLDELWSEGRHLLEPAGISKPMFRSVTVWSQGQYYIGYCSDHLDPDEIAFWRNWWERTVLPHSEIGQSLIANAGASYEKGLRDGAAQKPSMELCRRTLESWNSDMEAANELALRELR